MTVEVHFISLVQNIRFPCGRVVTTPGVDELVREGYLNPSQYLARHLSGDWGDVCYEDRCQNDAALKSREDRLFSSYSFAFGRNLWIITEPDRSVTTLLLPSEY